MISISVVISNGADAIASIPVSVEFVWTIFIGFISFIVVFLYSSFKYGEKVGEQKGYASGLKDGKKIGFSDGKRDFLNSTQIIDKVVCEHNPEKQPLLNGINLIRKNDGLIIDVECPFIEVDKTCQITKQKCMKLS